MGLKNVTFEFFLNFTLDLSQFTPFPTTSEIQFCQNRMFKQDRDFDETNKKSGNYCKQFMGQELH